MHVRSTLFSSCILLLFRTTQICFVGEAGFRDLSQVDPEASRLLSEAIAGDKSDEWEAKRLQREAMMAAKGV